MTNAKRFISSACAIAFLGVSAAISSADAVSLFSDNFDLSEGYTLGTTPSGPFIQTPGLTGQNGWTTSGIGISGSWVSNSTAGSPNQPTNPPDSGWGSQLNFTGTGYLHVAEDNGGIDSHALDASGVGSSPIQSITVQFDMARITDSGSTGLAPIQFSIGDQPFLEGVLDDGAASRVFSALEEPNGTVWSGGWTGSTTQAGGSWVWQDRVRAHFTFTITSTGITGGLDVLDPSLVNKTVGSIPLSNDSFSYSFPSPVDLSSLAASSISFEAGLNGAYTEYMLDNLSVVANTQSVPEPASLSLAGAGILMALRRRRAICSIG